MAERKIFINYRRADNADFVQHIRTWFLIRYGRDNVFMDFDTIPNFVKFADFIREKVRECDALVAIIGPRWLELLREKEAKGEDDFVRIEIEEALKNGKLVAPICIKEATPPNPKDLPAPMRPMLDFNIARLRDGKDVLDDIESIMDDMENAIPQKRSSQLRVLTTEERDVVEKPFDFHEALDAFFDAKDSKDWPVALAWIARLKDFGKTAALNLDKEEQEIRATLEREEAEKRRLALAKYHYKTVQILVRRNRPTEQIWLALQEVQEIYPDYDPDKIADKVRPQVNTISVSQVEIIVFRDAKGKETPYRVKLPLTAEQERLLNMIADHSTKPPERAEAGRKLAEAGDPRLGVGVDENGLPEFDWVEIPSKPFIYGSKDAYQAEPPITINDLPAFYISRYALTYAQYEPFVAGDGYENKNYWTKSGWEWKTENKKSVPYLWDDSKWHLSNHPVIGISYYESMAFCAWLSYQISGQMPDFKKPLSWPVRLPHEKEWERAARGTDGREYPWGKDYISGYGNINETWKDAKVGSYYLERTTAAGIYPQGASPEWVLDMSGNTWDWCLNKFESPDELNIDNNKLVVVRGGSWYIDLHSSRAAVRGWNDPGIQDDNVGCRGLCVRPPSR